MSGERIDLVVARYVSPGKSSKEFYFAIHQREWPEPSLRIKGETINKFIKEMEKKGRGKRFGLLKATSEERNYFCPPLEPISDEEFRCLEEAVNEYNIRARPLKIIQFTRVPYPKDGTAAP